MMDLIKLIINNIYNHKMLIVCSLLLMIALPESDAAAAVPNPYLDTEISTACPDNGQLFARIVHCFEDKIFQGTYYIVSELYPKYANGVYACMSLAVVFFGFMLATGGVQSVPKDTFTLLLKMTAIIFFMDNVMVVFDEFVSILSDMINEVASAGSGIFGGTLRCPANSVVIGMSGIGIATTPVWERVDCIVDGVLGLSASALNGGSGSPDPDLSRGSMAFFYHNLKSGALGLLIGLAGLYICFNLMLALFKGAYTYLIAVAVLSLMFIVGIIFMPAFLFVGTYAFFEKWYKVVLGMMLQAIILFAYLNVMMVAFDTMLFSGPNSIQKLVCASSSGPIANQSINQCAEDEDLYFDSSLGFAKEFDPSDMDVALSTEDLGTFGNIQISDEDIDFSKSTTVPIDFVFTRVDYNKIDPAEIAAATLLAGLCSYILVMFMNQLPAMATELAGGQRNNPSIIAGQAGVSDVNAPFESQLNSLASGKMAGDATKQVGSKLGSLIGGR